MKESRKKMIRQKASKPMHFLFRLIFSHTFVTIVLVVAQIVILTWMIMSISVYSSVAAVLFNLLSALALILIINDDEENVTFKLAWVIPICAFPVIGVSLYALGKFNMGGIGVRHRIMQREKLIKPYIRSDAGMKERLAEENPQLYQFSGYMERIGDAAIYENCDVKYYPLGDDQYIDILEDLKNAKKYIFMEFFIICRGEVWDTIIEILKEKVKEGIEVRVMYDGMCSLVNLPYNYPKKLNAFGIRAKQFSPIKPILSTHQNNRDHRKIIVVDGEIAYTGGVNLADEYMNKKVRFGHWKDNAIRIRGEAVKSFTAMFLQMWDLDEVKIENYEPYIKHPEVVPGNVDGYVIPYADGPHRMEGVAQRVYLQILNTAKHYVHIMTPYLILDQEMLSALNYAAQRGVDVTLILPHIPDKKMAFAIARTYYPVLISRGVKIYEYTPGFVHAKMFTSDDDTAVIGSINLDYRSLFLHYECAAYLYQNPVIADMEADFQKTLAKSERMTLEKYRKIPFGWRACGRICRIVGPLM